MHFTGAIQLVNEILTVALIIRIFALRLHNVYRVFSAFLLFEALSTLIVFIYWFFPQVNVDYRITWIGVRIVAWVLSLWMVYSLLKTILAKFPGIWRLSKRVLNITFPAAVFIAVLSARPEYGVLGVASTGTPLSNAVVFVLLLERVISTVALLALLSILIFILWFPIEMPRNLAVFSVGYVIYFASKTLFILLRSFWSQEMSEAFSNATSIVLIACFVYWLLFLNSKGEAAPVRLGPLWGSNDQNRLVGQLEAMNTALLRAARR